MLARDGIDAEVIDLRCIWPWDQQAIIASAEKTKRLLVVHEAVLTAGFGAEIAATVAEATGARVKRLGSPRIPVPFSPALEAAFRRTPEEICAAASVDRVGARFARPAKRNDLVDVAGAHCCAPDDARRA